MDTQNDFLDNAVNDELDIGQEVDMQSQMCSYLHDDMDENCSLLQSDTCGDGVFALAKSPSLSGVAGFYAKYEPVFLTGKYEDLE